MRRTTNIHHPHSLHSPSKQQLPNQQIRQQKMSHIISRKLYLDPIDILLIWTSHNSAIVNQDIDFIDLGIDGSSSGADGGLGGEIEGNKGGGDGGILRANGGD
jgi:hypothetical protein